VSELGEQVVATAKTMEELMDRIVITDEYGLRYRMTLAYAVGQRTDDPGIVVSIQRTPQPHE
jgi:hypothetical protein